MEVYNAPKHTLRTTWDDPIVEEFNNKINHSTVPGSEAQWAIGYQDPENNEQILIQLTPEGTSHFGAYLKNSHKSERELRKSAIRSWIAILISFIALIHSMIHSMMH